jgi:hypothetical protein
MRKELNRHFKSILTGEFKYIPSCGTDVLKTWKKTGWIPPTTVRNDYLFGSNR